MAQAPQEPRCEIGVACEQKTKEAKECICNSITDMEFAATRDACVRLLLRLSDFKVRGTKDWARKLQRDVYRNPEGDRESGSPNDMMAPENRLCVYLAAWFAGFDTRASLKAAFAKHERQFTAVPHNVEGWYAWFWDKGHFATHWFSTDATPKVPLSESLKKFLYGAAEKVPPRNKLPLAYRALCEFVCILYGHETDLHIFSRDDKISPKDRYPTLMNDLPSLTTDVRF